MTLNQTASSLGRDVSAQTLATKISGDLRAAIIRGELRPGEKLHVDLLRDHFAVSLSPVREALSRLSSAGFVEMQDQRGYRVAGVSPENLIEVTTLRTELEPLALRQALAHADDAWRDRLATAWEALKALPRCPADMGDDEAWEAAHRRFHFAMLAGCELPMLLSFVAVLHDMSDRYRRLFLQSNPHDRDVPQEHRRIFEAVMGDEAELACALLRQHIQRTGQNVRTALAASPVPNETVGLGPYLGSWGARHSKFAGSSVDPAPR